HRVRIVDPGGPNASKAAAGMIAPAMEAAIDDVSSELADLLRKGRDLWGDFAKASGVELACRPAEWRGPEAETIASRLANLGFEGQIQGEVVTTREDAQVEPEAAIARLRERLGASVICGEVAKLDAVGDGWAIITADQRLEADVVVLATGASAAIEGTPSKTKAIVQAIEPIRGQIGRSLEPLARHVTG
ncbi:hypothetical protein LTR94_026753, partial [Friedmanniomyces endolithicus]